MKYTMEDIGELVELTTETGRYIEERVVAVYCVVCGSQFIGIMREAGGFLAGHGAYHKWEYTQQATMEEMEA